MSQRTSECCYLVKLLNTISHFYFTTCKPTNQGVFNERKKKEEKVCKCVFAL